MFAFDNEHSVLTCLGMGGAYLMVEPGGPPPVESKTVDQNPITLRFNVADIDGAAAALAKKGVAFRRRDNPWGRTLDFTDPEGNACQIRDEVGFGVRILVCARRPLRDFGKASASPCCTARRRW